MAIFSKQEYGSWDRKDENMHENFRRQLENNCELNEESCVQLADYLQGFNDAKYVAGKCDENKIQEGCQPVDMIGNVDNFDSQPSYNTGSTSKVGSVCISAVLLFLIF